MLPGLASVITAAISRRTGQRSPEQRQSRCKAHDCIGRARR
ncbi:hypothetical protein I553_3899 [Mycobacterium xenopi 4042]|uniref:Uncharacterized protein n=1 Tax=Mycobacterium xenopi 4042 TaxID=1299334 RepID=X8DB74_MYCXE|nr:hypothetical protein I553_3899 [Mycobacterium xenopi 4042]